MSTIESVIKEFCDEYGYDFRDDYSGRCMFGETFGIAGDNTNAYMYAINDYLNDEMLRRYY